MKIIRFIIYVPATLCLLAVSFIALAWALSDASNDPDHPAHEGLDEFVWGSTFKNN
jgi:hypothetical protein